MSSCYGEMKIPLLLFLIVYSGDFAGKRISFSDTVSGHSVCYTRASLMRDK